MNRRVPSGYQGGGVKAIKKVNKKIIKILNSQSYTSLSYGMPKKTVILSCLVLFLLLELTEPFILNLFEPYLRLLVSFWYSTIPAVVCFFTYIVFRPLMDKYVEKGWLIKHDLAYLVCLIIFVGGVIYLYSFVLTIIFPEKFVLHDGFLRMCYNYSGVMCTIIFTMLKILDRLIHYREEAKNSNGLTEENEKIMFVDNKVNPEVLILAPASILYFESNRNYVHIYFIIQGQGKEERIEKRTLTKTLREIEQQLEQLNLGYFYKCHQSFVININQLMQFSGNSRKAFIMLKHGILIPVSRSKMSEFKTELLDEVESI